MADVMNPTEVVTMSFVSFDGARDLVRQAAGQVRTDDTLVYLNTMVDKADKDMVIALSKRYGVSQGFVLRAIFEQWREWMLSGDKDCE